MTPAPLRLYSLTVLLKSLFSGEAWFFAPFEVSDSVKTFQPFTSSALFLLSIRQIVSHHHCHKTYITPEVIRTIFSRSMYCECMDNCHIPSVSNSEQLLMVHDTDCIFFAVRMIPPRRGDDTACLTASHTMPFVAVTLYENA